MCRQGQHWRHGRRQALSPTMRTTLTGLRRLQFSAQSRQHRGVGAQSQRRTGPMQTHAGH